MEEELELLGGEGKDRIVSMEETTNKVIVVYDANGKIQTYEVPRTYIDYVKQLIDRMEVGERYTSTYIYNRFIDDFHQQSSIMKDRLPFIEAELIRHGLGDFIIKSIIESITKNKNIMRMEYKEFIGTRKADAKYFLIWIAIRYWKEKELIEYNDKGSIFRLK